ncbi:MAG: hypothetical protein VYD90_07895 [Pseudomonadota bacterium]|nr:hypothetical protein [Pseudomonadota bacterium]
MRTIEVNTAVYSAIWGLRQEGEETENDILARVLGKRDPEKGQSKSMLEPIDTSKSYFNRGPRTWSQPTWATDLAEVLEELGGKAPLQDIYDAVRKKRKIAGRSIPPSLTATVRRTLENHSSDSHNYTGGADLFAMPEGKGAGIWSLRCQGR